MATDFPDDKTPEPVLLHPQMSAEDADRELSANEIRRLRLALAAATAQCDELTAQNQALHATIKRLVRKG